MNKNNKFSNVTNQGLDVKITQHVKLTLCQIWTDVAELAFLYRISTNETTVSNFELRENWLSRYREIQSTYVLINQDIIW